jgi:hypothetical protein
MLVSVSDLTTYMDISLSMRQKDAADLVLRGLQSELEAYLRRPIEPKEFVEEYVLDSGHVGVPTGTFLSVNRPINDSFSTLSPIENTVYTEPPREIYLRNSPVISVDSVTVKPQFGSLRTLVEEVDYTVRRFAIDFYYGFSNDLVTVTYTAGLDGEEIPVFKLMILRAATREIQNMHDDVVGVKDLNTRNVAPLETGFTDRELNALRRYRRVRVA